MFRAFLGFIPLPLWLLPNGITSLKGKISFIVLIQRLHDRQIFPCVIITLSAGPVQVNRTDPHLTDQYFFIPGIKNSPGAGIPVPVRKRIPYPASLIFMDAKIFSLRF
jgi:hypothetical protein